MNFFIIYFWFTKSLRGVFFSQKKKKVVSLGISSMAIIKKLKLSKIKLKKMNILISKKEKHAKHEVFKDAKE